MYKLLFIAAVGTLVCWVDEACSVETGQEFSELVDRHTRPLVRDKEVAGLVVGISLDGEDHVFPFGETTLGSQTAPDGDTVYEIGSISKVFTGLMLAQGARLGQLKLDDPLQQHLPEDIRLDVFEEKPIQVVHLAAHTSGLPRMPANIRPANPANPYADYRDDQLYWFLKKHKLRRAPGEYEYSNLGSGLLGHILAQKGGASYEELLKRQICTPLAMKDTSITLSADQQARFAPPYRRGMLAMKDWDFSRLKAQPGWSAPFVAIEPDHAWDFATLAGAGAIRSTVKDLLKFGRAQYAADCPLAKDIQLTHEQQGTRADGVGVGLGWHLSRDKSMLFHSGMTGGYASWISVVPRRNLSVVVLCNTASEKVASLGDALTKAIYIATGKPSR